VALPRLLILTAYYLGLSVELGAITTIVLPELVQRLVDPSIKATALALVAAGQAAVSIAVQPVTGAWSDRVRFGWGRRRPLIVFGVAVQVALLAALPNAGTLAVVVVTMLLIELASNTAQGPYQGLLPDLVPRGRRGLASGLLGAAQLAGQVIGVAVAGLAVGVGRLDIAIGGAAFALALGAVVTVVGTPEPPPPAGRTVHGPRPRELLRVLRETWGSDLLADRGFIQVLASRLLILMATGTLQPFVYYYLQDSLGLGDQAGPAVAPIAALVAVVALLGAIPSGAVTARWGRVRTVAISGGLGAIGSLAFGVAPSYAFLFVVAIPFGLALGMFLAADWALMTDLVPQDEPGRYLGISNTVTASAGMLAIVVGGPLADLVNSAQAGLGYRAVFILAAVEFLAGGLLVRRVREPETAEVGGAQSSPPVNA
jgi:MFS family permease